jgi:large subunit ribosomal protein L24
MHIRKDDQVEVITGDDKGTAKDRRIAKVLRVIPARGKVVVEGVNRVYKHMRPSQKNPQGGRLSKEMPIDVSNVMLFCPKCNRGVRVGHRFTEEGRKQRYCKKCGANLGNVGPIKPAHAAKARAAGARRPGEPAPARRSAGAP